MYQTQIGRYCGKAITCPVIDAKIHLFRLKEKYINSPVAITTVRDSYCIPVVACINLCLFSPDCDFDTGMCGWKNDPKTWIKWSRRKGKTPTANTGPNADHTSGKGLSIGH